MSAAALRLGATVCVAAVVLATEAFAQDRAACFGAASQGQILRDAHKLVAAQRAFRMCAQQQCPDSMRNDCADWLSAVERSLPTVVVSAKNAAGADLVKVTVALDGEPFLATLDGKAVPLDPGPHTFHFEVAGAAGVDRQVVAKEGEKELPLAVVLAGAAEQAASFPTFPPPAGSPVGRRTLETSGWVGAGTGVAALVIGTIAGIVAIVDKNGAHCDERQHLCDPGPLGDARTAATVADVGLVGGGVLVAAGLGLVLVAPHLDRGHGAATVTLAPVAGSAAGGWVLRGSW